MCRKEGEEADIAAKFSYSESQKAHLNRLVNRESQIKNMQEVRKKLEDKER